MAGWENAAPQGQGERGTARSSARAPPPVSRSLFFVFAPGPRNQTYLAHHGVEDIPELKEGDKDKGGGETLGLAGLLGHHAEVDDDPANEPGAQLAEELNVKVADARVELVADEKVVRGVACPGAKGRPMRWGEGGGPADSRAQNGQQRGDENAGTQRQAACREQSAGR